jgi:hypothetical protein
MLKYKDQSNNTKTNTNQLISKDLNKQTDQLKKKIEEKRKKR